MTTKLCARLFPGDRFRSCCCLPALRPCSQCPRSAPSVPGQCVHCVSVSGSGYRVNAGAFGSPHVTANSCAFSWCPFQCVLCASFLWPCCSVVLPANHRCCRSCLEVVFQLKRPTRMWLSRRQLRLVRLQPGPSYRWVLCEAHGLTLLSY